MRPKSLASSIDFSGGQIAGTRDYQEDAYTAQIIEDRHGHETILAVVADGMGGHVGGALAAKLATDKFVSVALQSTPRISSGFTKAMDETNRAIAQHIAADATKAGMGCTLLAVSYADGYLHWASIGDSVLYRISGQRIERLNADHSLAPQIDAAAARGEITYEEAQNSSDRHVLRSALTGDKLTLVDIPLRPIKVLRDDWIVAASDGIATLPDDQVVGLLRSEAGLSAKSAVSKLLHAIEQHAARHQDNATIVAIRIGEVLTEDRDQIPTRPIPAR